MATRGSIRRVTATMAEVIREASGKIADGGRMVYLDPADAARIAAALAANGHGNVREARAQALKDAAAELARLQYVKPGAEGRDEYERMLAIRRGNTDAWLKARAERELAPAEPLSD